MTYFSGWLFVYPKIFRRKKCIFEKDKTKEKRMIGESKLNDNREIGLLWNIERLLQRKKKKRRETKWIKYNGIHIPFSENLLILQGKGIFDLNV